MNIKISTLSLLFASLFIAANASAQSVTYTLHYDGMPNDVEDAENQYAAFSYIHEALNGQFDRLISWQQIPRKENNFVLNYVKTAVLADTDWSPVVHGELDLNEITHAEILICKASTGLFPIPESCYFEPLHRHIVPVSPASFINTGLLAGNELPIYLFQTVFPNYTVLGTNQDPNNTYYGTVIFHLVRKAVPDTRNVAILGSSIELNQDMIDLGYTDNESHFTQRFHALPGEYLRRYIFDLLNNLLNYWDNGQVIDESKLNHNFLAQQWGRRTVTWQCEIGFDLPSFLAVRPCLEALEAA